MIEELHEASLLMHIRKTFIMSSGLQCHVVEEKSDVSEEYISSLFRVQG
jgi:hypothetical protein